MFGSLIYVLLTVTSALLVEGNRISRLEKRFNVLEQRMLEDAITYRGDIEMILQKLDAISNKTSDDSHGRKLEVENVFEKSEPGVKDEKFVQILKKTMNEEKQHIRNVLLEVRRETENMKNEFIDMETKVFEKQKEQGVMFDLLKQDFIHQMTEMQKQYEELNKKVANNYDSTIELFNKQLESKYNELSKEISSDNGLLSSSINEIVEKLRILSRWSCLDSFGGSCYYVGGETLTWEGAFTKCASLGSHLVEVNSHAENTFLKKLAMNKNVSEPGVWLGASDRSIEGIWTWGTSGISIGQSYTYFKSPEPNGKTRENCLQLKKSENWKWNDSPCSESQRFICERSQLFVED